MSAAEFELRYEGPALAAGYIDARDLAPALQAMSDLLHETNRVVNGDRCSVQVNVRAGFQRGSFGIEFTVELMSDTDAASSVLAGVGSTQSEYLLVLLGITDNPLFSGLWQLIKKLRGKKPAVVKMSGDKAQAFTGDGQKINIHNGDVINVFNDSGARRSIGGIVAPLEKDGIERVQARLNGKTVAEIEKGEREYYDPNRILTDEIAEDGAEEITRQAQLQINRPVLKGEYVWNFSEFGSPIRARMGDDDFRRRVENGGVSFSAGDVLIVRLKIIPRMTKGGQQKAAYEVLEVLDHRSAQHYQQRALIDRGSN